MYITIIIILIYACPADANKWANKSPAAAGDGCWAVLLGSSYLDVVTEVFYLGADTVTNLFLVPTTASNVKLDVELELWLNHFDYTQDSL
jgi:hypothetical protein